MRHIRTSNHSTRFAAAAAAAVLLGAALSGCGSDSKDADDAPKASVLSETEATAALLVEGNLGDELKVSTDASDADDAPGCMDAVSAVLGDDDDAENTAKRDFESDDIAASNKVLSYESVAAAEKAMSDVRKALKSCTEVKETDDDGFSYELTVETDDEKSVSDADDQVNAVASGAVTASGATGQSQVALHLALVRVDNNITGVTASTFDSELPGPLSDVVEVVFDRLVAVMDGKTPDDSVVAGA